MYPLQICWQHNKQALHLFMFPSKVYVNSITFHLKQRLADCGPSPICFCIAHGLSLNFTLLKIIKENKYVTGNVCGLERLKYLLFDILWKKICLPLAQTYSISLVCVYENISMLTWQLKKYWIVIRHLDMVKNYVMNFSVWPRTIFVIVSEDT